MKEGNVLLFGHETDEAEPSVWEFSMVNDNGYYFILPSCLKRIGIIDILAFRFTPVLEEVTDGYFILDLSLKLPLSQKNN